MKAAKKEKKDLDDDDKAYLEKKKAGMLLHPGERQGAGMTRCRFY